jgi:hypothetical protein
VFALVRRDACSSGGVASRTLPLDFDFDDLAPVDLDPVDFAAADFERDEAPPERDVPEPERFAGVLFLDEPQLDMSPIPYQQGVTANRYRLAGRCHSPTELVHRGLTPM